MTARPPPSRRPPRPQPCLEPPASAAELSGSRTSRPPRARIEVPATTTAWAACPSSIAGAVAHEQQLWAQRRGRTRVPVDGRRSQKHLALIIARELASQLATATFIADAGGSLVFYNEAAETILGRTFVEAGRCPGGGWTSQFLLEDVDGAPMSLDRMPAGIALIEQRPAHGKLRMTGLDGERRLLSVTAVPLFASETEFVGMIALFWQSSPDDA